MTDSRTDDWFPIAYTNSYIYCRWFRADASLICTGTYDPAHVAGWEEPYRLICMVLGLFPELDMCYLKRSCRADHYDRLTSGWYICRRFIYRWSICRSSVDELSDLSDVCMCTIHNRQGKKWLWGVVFFVRVQHMKACSPFVRHGTFAPCTRSLPVGAHIGQMAIYLICPYII